MTTETQSSRMTQLMIEFLERDAVIRTMYRWGYGIDRQDWAAVESVTAPDLRAEMWLSDQQVVNAQGREFYLGAAASMFKHGLRASMHAYTPAMEVMISGNDAHARWPGAITNDFGGPSPERGEGLSDAWFIRDATTPTGWRATRIVFKYVWNYDQLAGLMKRSTQ